MINRRIMDKMFGDKIDGTIADADLERVVTFYNEHSSLKPWIRYFHPGTGLMKRSLGRDCEDGMRQMERPQ